MVTKRLIYKIALFLSIAILLDQLLGICLEELADRVSLDFRARTRLKEFYEYRENVDILFLGSSHAYMGFNPYIFDDVLHVNSFNLGTAGQNPIVTYHLLKEALRIGHKPELVVMEVFWGVLREHKNDHDYAAYVFRSMRFSQNKLALLRSAFKFPSALKLVSRLLNDRYLIELCAKFLSGADIGHYIGKGYVEYTSTVPEDALLGNTLEFGEINLEPRRLHYLEKTISLALERGIRIIFVSAPIAPTVFRNSRDYQNVRNTIRKIAGKYGVEYIDYNILNDDLRMLTDENFRDRHHLNRSGVEIFNKHLAQRFTDLYGWGLGSLKAEGVDNNERPGNRGSRLHRLSFSGATAE